MTTALFDTAVEVETLRGTITRVMYAEAGRVVAKINVAPESRKAPDGSRRPYTMSVLGSMAEPMIGQQYEFSGKVSFNDKFKSHEIRFDSYRTILPGDRDGIISYLIDVAKWVGPSHAKALVDALQSDTLRIIRDEPERVEALQIPGLTAERIQQMQKTLKDNEQIEAATVEVNNLLGGVLGPATVRKAINKWGCDAATKIKANPFILGELYGVGFVSADAVHKKIGGDPGDLNRHYGALIHVLHEAASREGHTILRMDRVQADAARLIGPLRPEVFNLCTEDEESVGVDGAHVCLHAMGRAEKYIAGKLQSMMEMGLDEHEVADCSPARLQQVLDSPEVEQHDKDNVTAAVQHCRRIFPAIDTTGLAPDQAAAVAAFQNAPVFILCGAPGTGKTFTVARIVKSLIGAGLTVELAAPTGKAAKQMSLALAEVCPQTALTIHSLLAPTVDEDSGEFRFGRDESNPLDCDVLIVDEFSMVDVPLCRSLLRAVRETTRLLIVGDHYQLPSVGPGAVLRDLLAAGVPHHELTEIKRNAGLIVRQCHAMKDGRSLAPVPRLDLESGGNWRHIEAGEPAEIKAIIEVLVRDKLPGLQVDRLWGWQLISPTNEAGPLSCDALNDLAREVVNPAADPVKGLAFRVGDKVVRCKNGTCKGEMLEEPDTVELSHFRCACGWQGGADTVVDVEDPGGPYGNIKVRLCPKCGRPVEEDVESVRRGGGGEIRIVNGDIGIVERIAAREITVRFRYPDRRAYIKEAEHHLKAAYCMTCHKMQGSEVPVVILPLHRSLSRLPMVTREWIYTAFSRAKSFIITVGDVDAVGPMVAKRAVGLRKTTLAERLQSLQWSHL
ncbi:MAG: AAA family ATPase [Planctomycetes bacterium]|nr:AAA family ATPase [Planctomycetota bacterium]